MRRRLTASIAVATVMLVFGTGLAAESDSPATAPVEVVERIVNGITTADFPSTGALLSSGNPSSAGVQCSGTLIGCQTFLTAGHCVADDLNPSHYTVFLQHAGFFSVTSVALHPTFTFPVGDVSVLKLGASVNGIRPTAINTTASPASALAGTIAGFGRSGGVNTDYGIKRAGSVQTAQCKNGISGTTSVCWNFTAPLSTPGTNSNTCNGDSGGPLFIDFGAGVRVAGVTSGGNADDCLPTDTSFDANVFNYRSWIQQQGGSDLDNISCGSLPQVDDNGTTVVALTGQLSAASSTATGSFQISPGAAVLRVTMNAIDNGSDFDLYVKAGSPASTSSFDCKQDGPGQFGACEFTPPATGTWYVLVNRFSGSGTYQVTATAFNGGCADLANNGQSCDDGNPCTTNDRCQAGACAGTSATNGTACDDGNPCTQSDSCQDGACSGSAAPRTDCHEPFVTPSGLFRLQDTTPGEPANSDKLTWQWLRGSATQMSEFGDPLSSTDYDLCVYDETDSTPALVMSEHIAAGATCGSKPCWKETATSFKYIDNKLLNGPIKSLVLKPGSDGKAKITLKGKGTDLGMPTLPLHDQNTVTVQLTNGAACWQAQYGDTKHNTIYEFYARAN
jgi:Trypsin/Bacterial pre-peptidase C-terminal domain